MYNVNLKKIVQFFTVSQSFVVKFIPNQSYAYFEKSRYLDFKIFRDQPFERFGLLLIGCSPGGTSSNFWTAFFKGR